MARDYLDIKNSSNSSNAKVRQSLKFRTGKFVWRVKFNIPLDPLSVNNNNLFVKTTNDEILSTIINYNEESNEIEIEPAGEYAQDKEYVLNITTRVRSAKGNPLKEPLQVQFKID